MRSRWLAAFVLAVGCTLGGPAPSTPPGPRTLRCDDLRRGVVGSWMREGSAMDIRADGSLLRDAVEGAFRWTAPGRATIDVAGSHEEHTYGLMTAGQLLDVDAEGHTRTWTRVSVTPAFRADCWDVRGSLVGDWTDGTSTESFLADGTYVRGETRGNWSTPDAGYLEVAIGMRVRRYRLAFATPDTIVSAVDGPVVDEDPRGAPLVETRAR